MGSPAVLIKNYCTRSSLIVSLLIMILPLRHLETHSVCDFLHQLHVVSLFADVVILEQLGVLLPG